MIIRVRSAHHRCQAQSVAQDTEQIHSKHFVDFFLLRVEGYFGKGRGVSEGRRVSKGEFDWFLKVFLKGFLRREERRGFKEISREGGRDSGEVEGV